MKKASILLAILLMTLGAEAANISEKNIPFTKLPKKAQVFFKQYFATKVIAAVRLESDYFLKKEYTIFCKDGAKVKFTSSGDWSKIDMKRDTVPKGIVPSAILQYLHKSFPNTYVNEIERTGSGYDVDVSNGLDVVFDKKGAFLRIDD